jgi:rhodanese-related sulfurtransferase
MRTAFYGCRTAILAAVLFAMGPRIGAAPDKPSSSGDTAPSGLAKRISLAEFDKLRTDKKFQIVDVRSPGEFASGHVPGATNININASDFEKRVEALGRDKPCLVYCAAGVRSARAVGKMNRLGFLEVSDFSGGWSEYKKAGKPVEK